MFSFVKNCQTVLQNGYHFCILTSNESSCWFSSLPAFGVVSVLEFSHSNRCIEVFHCYFNLQLPSIGWTSFICIFSTCISSLMRYQFRSLLIFKIGLFVSFVLSFERFLYSLDISPLSDMCFANIFCQPVLGLLILLSFLCRVEVFCRAEVFNIYQVQYQFFFFYETCF